MIANKHITKIVIMLTVVGVSVCLLSVLFSEKLALALENTGIEMEYDGALFDTTEILEVNILMENDDWEDMLSNAMAEEYYQCDVEVNGETFYRVGIRPKGNTSLSSIASDPTTDRYSLKLEFDQYVDGQTCYGLDKLILNNSYADATNMKEALIYDMFSYLGADASLYNYAKVSVNGEYWGVYLALEAVEDSFLLRNYGTENGELYKPDGMDMGERGGFSMGGGADLNYIDDDTRSYSTIWEGEVTDTTEADHKRVVTALKHMAEGDEIEKYMDVDNLLRYMAVHAFSVNDDSLSGTMAHNYYLYETDGKLNILPWDYNLALGGMGSGSDASSVVNETIENVFKSTNFFDALMENDEYHRIYCDYLSKLAEEYLLGEGFEAFYERTREQIDTLVESDPNAFYSYEEYEVAADTFYEVVKLRGESIRMQLEEIQPDTVDETRISEKYVDASHLDLSVMGSMNMGRGMMDKDKNEEVTGNIEKDSSSGTERQRPERGDFTDFAGEMPGGFDMPQFDGEMPEEFDMPQFDGERQGDFDASKFEGGNFRDTGNMTMQPETDFSVLTNIAVYSGLFVLMVGAIVFAALYKRRGKMVRKL